MKRIIFFNIAITALLLLSGCEKYLDETNVVNIETKENGFVLESHADQTITAIYANLRDRDGLDGRSGHVLFDCGSADMKITRESNAVNNYSFTSSKDDEAFPEFWKQMYSVIGRCNSSMELVPQTEAPEAKKSRYNSEAKVLRAIVYYNLMMAYNTCPLVLESIDPGDRESMLKGDATRDEIYRAMIADLEEALKNTNLPWEKDLSAKDKGHVGQATARTILTYLHLTRAWEKGSADDFEKAKKYSKEVIDQGGYTLEPVLLDAYYKKYNTESIFELGCSNMAAGLGNRICPWFAPMTNAPGGDPKQYGGWFKLEMTQYFYDAMQDGDVRRYLLANGKNGNNMWAPKFIGGDKYGGDKLVVDDIKDNDFGLSTYQGAKGAGAPADWLTRVDDYGSQANWNIYRLSDVYLLYAEACIKTGKSDEARTYINKVRERARNAWTSYLGEGDPAIPTHISGIPAEIASSVSGDDLLVAMKNERRIELHSEMKRMIDIRRWSLGGAKDLEIEVEISGSWANKFKWYPKPQDQVDLSQGSVIQNTGY